MMKNKILTMSNNVFSLESLAKKEFVEMILNFIRISKLSNAISSNNNITEETIEILEEIGIIQDKQSLADIKKTLNTVQFSDLIKIANFFVNNNIEEFSEIKKYSLKYRNRLSNEEKKSNKPTIMDLFCGAGGLSLGFVQNDFKIVCANDIEKSALRTYMFNHPEISGRRVLFGDIVDLVSYIDSYIQDEEIDVIVGGPPCQGFSMANRQRLIDDPRNILYKNYVEIVQKIQPKIFVMENVKGMLSVANQVIEDFNKNSNNYDISYKVFNLFEYGVPQKRERLIYIGVHKSLNYRGVYAKDILNGIREKEERFVLQDALYNLKELSASREKNATEKDSEISGYKIDKMAYKRNTYLDLINGNSDNDYTYNHKARYNNDRDIEIYGRMIPGDNSSSDRIKDIMPYKSRSHIFKDKYFKLVPTDASKTITAHMKFDCNMYIHPYQARGLTPREAARIQSYPDSYFFLGPYTKTYMQIGNSVPPIFGRAISKIIKKILIGVKDSV